MIYFDNAATTRALPAVAEKMSTMLCEQYGNPASVSAMGLAAEKEIRNAAEIIARGIHCKYDEVFFTSASALCCRIEEIDGKKVGGRDAELIARIQKAAWDEALAEVKAING